jgi:hypothetical protein
MDTFLHVLRRDSATLAGAVIEAAARAPGARVTVVLLDDAPAPDLPAAVRTRRLTAGDLDYASLLDLVFDSDHVIAW